MRSRHADDFNHDDIADVYDDEVQNERDPIRAGYQAVLDWVVARAGIGAQSTVVDLGAGTGNTSRRIRQVGQLICVDISENMLRIARSKLAHLGAVRYVKADLLEFFREAPDFDALISTYAVHHLTEDEKRILFEEIGKRLTPGGRAVFGDLMLADAEARQALYRKYRDAGDTDTLLGFDEEFFWRVDGARAALSDAGFIVDEVKRFSDLSWGICAVKSPQAIG